MLGMLLGYVVDANSCFGYQYMCCWICFCENVSQMEKFNFGELERNDDVVMMN
jgi:hypothetical protein